MSKNTENSPGDNPEKSATLHVTVKWLRPGLFISLGSDGEFSDESFERRFYSIPEQPPDDITPLNFWGEILRSISYFLSQDGS